MAISLTSPTLDALFATPTVTLRDGLYQIDSVLTADERRALLWGRQRGLDRWLVIERVCGLAAGDLEEVVARRAIALGLDNDNLAHCLDVFTEKGALYTVQATGAGTTLDHLSPLDAPQVIEIGIQIANALNYLHRCPHGPGHGTITPASVFFTAHGRVKLTNFIALLGIADPESDFASILCDNARAEVFSVAATLHHALTGWQGSYRAGAPTASDLRPEINPDLSAVLARALATEPTERFASVADLRYALLRLQ